LKHGCTPQNTSSPPGVSTRAASATTPAKSSTSVDVHMVATVGNVPSANGRAAASPCTIRRDRVRAWRSWSAEKSSPTTVRPVAASASK